MNLVPNRGCHLAGAYHEGEFNFAYPYPYIILIENFAQLVSPCTSFNFGNL